MIEAISVTHLTSNSRNTTFEQQPRKTPQIAKTAFAFMIQLFLVSRKILLDMLTLDTLNSHREFVDINQLIRHGLHYELVR